MAREPVNERQLEVLRWIADECPDGVMTDQTHKLSAAALKSRRLVKVSKRGGWHAEITDDGQYYLNHGEYPEGQQRTSRKASHAGENGAVTATSPSPTATLPPADQREGTSDLQKSTCPEVNVPRRLTRPHPIVLGLQDAKKDWVITAPASNRALRIIQALITTAQRRGWTAESSLRAHVYPAQDWFRRKYEFVINTGETREKVTVLQENDRQRHEPSQRELAEKERSPHWTRIPEYDYIPSQRLKIELDAWTSRGKRNTWADRERWSLEDRLPQVIDEIASRSETEKDRRLEREREEAGRQRSWQLAVETAKARFAEAHRAKVLVRQADDWRQAQELRTYLGAMALIVDGMTDAEEAARSREWLEWGRRYAESLDPLSRRLAIPDVPEPTGEALMPFLQGSERPSSPLKTSVE